MKTKFSFVAAILAVLTLVVLNTQSAKGADIIEMSPAEAVLFQEGALLKKEAELRIVPGLKEYLIYGLSPFLKEESLQIEMAPSQVKVIEVKIFDTFLKDTSEKKLKELQEALKAIKKNIAEKEATKRAIETYIELAKKKEVCDKPLRQCMKEIEPLIKDYYKDLANLSLDISELNRKKEKIEKELQGIGSPKKTKALRLQISAPEGVEHAILKVSYFVDNAGWNPYYVFRVDTGVPELRIQYMAEIEQRTGEDWKSVKVVLSTEKPFLGGRLPEPTPWFVDFYESRIIFNKGRALSLAPKEKSELKPQKPKIKEETLSFKVDLPGRINLPSGVERTKMVLVAQKSTPVSISYRSFPKVTERVFLEGKFKNPFKIPIFHGQGIIFVDGLMSNRVSIGRPILSGSETSLSLGVDPSITARKKLKKRYTEIEGILSKEKKVHYEYEIKVQNGKPRQIELIIQDTLPVSSNEKIVVETIRPEPKEAEVTKDGIATWNLKLKAHEERDIPVIFTVRYPKDSKVIGLP